MNFRSAVTVAVVGAIALAAFVLLRDSQPIRSEFCTAKAGQYSADIDLEQARWAALIAAKGQRLGMPVRATTIAIATAFQESKIHNISYGDRDSLGLFQQRPSQGWGTRAQIIDPHYSIGRFYEALAKVGGYGSMAITEAAQRVQRSADGTAYAQHEGAARALASTLRGYSPAKFNCQIKPVGGGIPHKIRDDAVAAFGPLDAEVHAGYVTFAVAGADSSVHGWALAHYLVAQAARLHITQIDFADRRWTAEDSPEGWVQSPSHSDSVRVKVS